MSTDPGTTPYPLTHYISDDLFSLSHQAFLAAVIGGVEPTSFKKAVKDEVWNNDMGDEIEAFEMTGTWSVVDFPPRKVAFGNKWVYRLKYNADGSLERHKGSVGSSW